jgi:hypothetical protein
VTLANAFFCEWDASGDVGALADPCEFFNTCDPGLACVAASTFADCTGAACCTPYCDLEAPSCPLPELDCAPFFEPGQAPWGYEDVGVCLSPS